MDSFGSKVHRYFKSLSLPSSIPSEIECLNPFGSEEVQRIMEKFYHSFYKDDHNRTFLIGINPGRNGAGVTSIPFTDPIRLKDVLGIDHGLPLKPELSSIYIYDLISRLGGPALFYQNFYITSVSPVGFVKDGKNVNYYDFPELEKSLKTYIVDELKTQIEFGANPIAYSIGKGKNVKYLTELNKEYHFFSEIRPLPHPRWVMQYKLKDKERYLNETADELKSWVDYSS
ncbi:DUF4918 family protein [bacterium AH-315-C07]|nr:DUF4918 family protein [bacterium AH-315-C07]